MCLFTTAQYSLQCRILGLINGVSALIMRQTLSTTQYTHTVTLICGKHTIIPTFIELKLYIVLLLKVSNLPVNI